MYGHRPPTAPATPDNDLLAGWSNQYPQHPQAQAQAQAQHQAQAMAMYERSRYGGQGGGGQGGGQGQGQYQQQQQQYINQNDHLMPSNLATQGQPLRGHTPQSQQPSTAGTMGAPLILNNLTQHLNNPPAPSVSHGGYHAPNQPQTSSKQLIAPNGQHPPVGSEEEKIFMMVTELLDPETREHALLELSKKRETYEDLALVLWGGFGVMASLILEIVSVYPSLSPASLSAHASNRVCNALALLQCVASHNETRSLFLNAHIPLFLYPFLNTTSKTRPFEYLRLTSLGVIGALVKQNENSDVINFLLSTEIIPLCLRIMETGSELSKTVAIFIVQKILLDDLGLQYICQTYERFYAVGTVLSNMVTTLAETQATRLLKHVVRCYLRMSDNPRAREALRACLPDSLRDGTFGQILKGDQVTKRCLATLIANLERDQSVIG